MPIAIWQKQSEGYICTWRPVSQKESGASRCQLSPYLVSCAVVPPSLGPGSLGPEFIDFARCCVKQGIVQLCRAEGAGVEGGGFWGLLLTLGFTKILFLVTPLLQLHRFLHLPEVLGFKSGSFVAFLTTSLQFTFPEGLKLLLRVHLFSGSKIWLLLSLFSLLLLFLILRGLCIDYPIIFHGISEGNERKGMCLSSHL